ncbi:MAG TPA: hypothetical protein VI454_18175 [Verrucomicrobiae bacterium]
MRQLIQHGFDSATGSSIGSALAENTMNWLTDTAKALARGMGDLSPSCKAATRLQSEALDRKLPLRQRFGLRLHLMLCKWCRRYGKQIAFLREAAHEHPDELAEPVPQKLSNEARERIKQRLQADKE